jgi:hypothetical protein
MPFSDGDPLPSPLAVYRQKLFANGDSRLSRPVGAPFSPFADGVYSMRDRWPESQGAQADPLSLTFH